MRPITSTGDMEGNLHKLQLELKAARFNEGIDIAGLKAGLPAAFLPLLHFAFLGFSRRIARFLSNCGYELFAKSDLRFVESVMKVLRDQFGYRSHLTTAQFLSNGFAERKVILVYETFKLIRAKHNELTKQQRSPGHKRNELRMTNFSSSERSVRVIRAGQIEQKESDEQRHTGFILDSFLPAPHSAPPQSPLARRSLQYQPDKAASLPRQCHEPEEGVQYHDTVTHQPAELAPCGEARVHHEAPHTVEEFDVLRQAESDASAQEEAALREYQEATTADQLTWLTAGARQGMEALDTSCKQAAMQEIRAEKEALHNMESANKAAIDDLAHKVKELGDRFTVLEFEAARSKEDLQAKVTILEGRIRFLESIKAQKEAAESAKKAQPAAPKTTLEESAPSWTSRTMRDMTNLQDAPIPAQGITPNSKRFKGKTSTSDFIANIKARFESTRELLAENQSCNYVAPRS